jgi:hypothetical protein
MLLILQGTGIDLFIIGLSNMNKTKILTSKKIITVLVRVMAFNATFNSISAISKRPNIYRLSSLNSDNFNQQTDNCYHMFG